jgi:hypothetical protein
MVFGFRSAGLLGGQASGFNLNLLDQLSFYGSYHRNPVNKLIHLACVPGIAWSALVWFAAYGPLVQGVHFGGVLASVGVPGVLARCEGGPFIFFHSFFKCNLSLVPPNSLTPMRWCARPLPALSVAQHPSSPPRPPLPNPEKHDHHVSFPPRPSPPPLPNLKKTKNKCQKINNKRQRQQIPTPPPSTAGRCRTWRCWSRRCTAGITRRWNPSQVPRGGAVQAEYSSESAWFRPWSL